MSSPPDMVRRVQELLRSSVAVEVSPETDLIGNGLLDSLALVNVLLGIEQEFGIQVVLEDIELETFRTVQNIANFLTDKLREEETDPPSKP